MRYNRTRHFLLGILSRKFNEDLSSQRADKSGLSYEEVDDFLRKRKKDRTLIVSELYENEEIKFFDLDNVKGYMINPIKGLSAYTSKKYLNRNNEIILNWLKNTVQIFIPIASLIVAVLALSLRQATLNEKNDLKFNELDQRIIKLEQINNDQIELNNDTIINK
jgi:hypothetical protein